MIAAVVSSLTSLFNSASTIITLDIWHKIRPKCRDLELLIVGRIFIILLAGVSIMWIPIMQEQEGGQIIRYSTKAVGYVGAPTSAVFLLAMFWPRCTEPGVFWGMLISAVVGISRLILDFFYKEPYCGEPDTRPVFIAKFHGYYHFTLEISIAFLVAVVISLLTKPIPKEKLEGVTFWTRMKKPYYEKDEEKSVPLETNTQTDGQVKVGFQNEHLELKPTESDQISEKGTVEVKRPRQKSCLRIIQIICGLPSSDELEERTPGQVNDDYQSRLAFLKEPRAFRILMNVNVVIIVIIWFTLYIVFA